jgi:hypothetical protein
MAMPVMRGIDVPDSAVYVQGVLWEGYTWFRKDASLRIIRHLWFKRQDCKPDCVYFTSEQNYEQFKDDLDMKGEDYLNELNGR